jgi:hypothetical protein
VSAAARLAALPPVSRRVIALTLLAAMPLLAWFAVVLPLGAALSSQTEWREDTARTIARDRGMVGTAQDLREVASAVESSPLHARFYETGGVSPVEDTPRAVCARIASSSRPSSRWINCSHSSSRSRVNRATCASSGCGWMPRPTSAAMKTRA